MSFTRTVPHLPPSPCVHTLLSALTLLSPTCAPLSRSSHPRFVDETAGVGGGHLPRSHSYLQVAGGTRSWASCLCGWLLYLPATPGLLEFKDTLPHPSLSLSLSPCYLGREGRSSQCVSYCLSSHVCCSHLALVPWGTCTLACCPLPRLRNHFAILFSSQERAFCFFCSLMKQIGSDRKLL